MNTTAFIEKFYQLPYFILTRLPLNLFSKLAGYFADHPLSKSLIPFFIKKFGVCLDEAEMGIERYPTLNAFFTRKLKEGLRTFDQSNDRMISPADGVFSYSKVIDGKIWVIKNKSYSLPKLIAQEQVGEFHEGHAVTIYLSPKDYHRFHMPLDGEITALPQKIEGYLFSVLPSVISRFDDLFCVNERLVYSFKNETYGTFFIVAVGATFVGSIVDRIEGENRKVGDIMRKGKELGAFKFGGSSIILITKKGFPLASTQKSSGENEGEIRFGDVL